MPLSALVPLNVASEKRKFFEGLARGERYEPHFTYRSGVAAARELEKVRSRLSEDHLQPALAILTSVIEDYGSEAAYQDAVWGAPLSFAEVDEMCTSYLRANGLAGLVRFRWSSTVLVTSCGKVTAGGTATVNLVRQAGSILVFS